LNNIDHVKKKQGNEHFRGILVVQQKVTTHILQYWITQDSNLSSLFRTQCVYTKRASSQLSISPTDVKKRFLMFAEGTCNLLILSAISDEGIDIMSPSPVMIFFDQTEPPSGMGSQSLPLKPSSQLTKPPNRELVQLPENQFKPPEKKTEKRQNIVSFPVPKLKEMAENAQMNSEMSIREDREGQAMKWVREEIKSPNVNHLVLFNNFKTKSGFGVVEKNMRKKNRLINFTVACVL